MTITTSAAQPPVETQEASSPLAAYARNYIARVRAGLTPGRYVAQVRHHAPTGTGAYSIRARRR